MSLCDWSDERHNKVREEMCVYRRFFIGKFSGLWTFNDFIELELIACLSVVLRDSSYSSLKDILISSDFAQLQLSEEVIFRLYAWNGRKWIYEMCVECFHRCRVLFDDGILSHPVQILPILVLRSRTCLMITSRKYCLMNSIRMTLSFRFWTSIWSNW